MKYLLSTVAAVVLSVSAASASCIPAAAFADYVSENSLKLVYAGDATFVSPDTVLETPVTTEVWASDRRWVIVSRPGDVVCLVLGGVTDA